MSRWLHCLESAKSALPGSLKTCLWMIRITVAVSFAVFLLDYFGMLDWISALLEPMFEHFGLPGGSALAFVCGFFVNCYSALAVGMTLGLSARAMTILGVMVLCAHNVIVETSVQKKTGTQAWKMVVVRLSSAIILGFLLNFIIPSEFGLTIKSTFVATTDDAAFFVQFKSWLLSLLSLIAKMIVLIFSLNILQRLLSDFGIIKWISRFLKPLLAVFGLPARCSFLWIIANVVGLAYGAAAMIEEVDRGKINQRDIDLLNMHIGISHSNVEDLILFSLSGAVWWIMLLARWAFATIIVWTARLLNLAPQEA